MSKQERLEYIAAFFSGYVEDSKELDNKEPDITTSGIWRSNTIELDNGYRIEIQDY